MLPSFDLFFKKNNKNAIIIPIAKHPFFISTDVGFSEHVSRMIREYEDIYILATTSLPRSKIPQQVSDIVSVKIPLALHHRCLHYSHLVLGEATLVAAYITDYFEPYDLRHILKAHSSSPAVKFSRSSSILPLGVEFKVHLLIVYLNK